MPKPAVPEQQWGEKVDSLSVNGVEETPRKFCAHVRRALILYICLLRDTGDLDALRGVVTALRGRDFGSYTDIGRSGLFDSVYTAYRHANDQQRVSAGCIAGCCFMTNKSFDLAVRLSAS